MASDLALFKAALTQSGVEFTTERKGVGVYEPCIEITIVPQSGPKNVGFKGMFVAAVFDLSGQLVEFGIWE